MNRFVRGARAQAWARLRDLDRDAEALPPREREALYRRALAEAIEEHRSLVGKVVGPIVLSLLIFFGVAIAIQLLPRGTVPMSIRPMVVPVLIGQMVLVLVLVAARGRRAGAAKTVELELRKRVEQLSRAE